MAGTEEGPEKNSEIILVYPNPVYNEIQVRFTSNVEEQQLVQLFDLSGREVFQSRIHSNVGENIIEMDLTDIKSGAYIFMKRGSEIKCERIIKK